MTRRLTRNDKPNTTQTPNASDAEARPSAAAQRQGVTAWPNVERGSGRGGAEAGLLPSLLQSHAVSGENGGSRLGEVRVGEDSARTLSPLEHLAKLEREKMERLAAWKERNKDSIDPRPLRWDCSRMKNWGGSGRTCGKWRCFRCQGFAVRRDAFRIQRGLEADDRRWFFWVLTLSRSAHKRDIKKNYAKWAENWKKLLRKVTQWVGKVTYVSVLEMHASGQPHANILITSDFLSGASEAELKLFKRWLKDTAPAHQFGWRLHFQPISRDQIPHVAKYSASLGVCKSNGAGAAGIAGEMSKAAQLPTFAPRGTRRIRATQKFLPPESAYKEEMFPPLETEDAIERYHDTMRDRIETYQLYRTILEG